LAGRHPVARAEVEMTIALRDFRQLAGCNLARLRRP
jgi:hypothetical protein